MSANNTIVILAAGTGGHIYPALEVATYLKQNQCNILWIGTSIGLEQKLVKQSFPMFEIQMSGLRNKHFTQKLKAVWQLVKSTVQLVKLYRKEKPRAVIAFGGYISAPGGVAAYLAKVPLIIQEQNSKIGSANKLLSVVATKIFTGFPNVVANALWSGNPIRQQLVANQHNIDVNDKKLRVLIIGGSQGALFLNEMMPKVANLLKQSNGIEIVHQSGQNHYLSTLSAYQNCAIQCEVKPYCDDIASDYMWADCIICRAGAMTVTEVVTIGLPAIFVPLPNSIDNHQQTNAAFVADSGGAILFVQKNVSASQIAKQLVNWAADKNQLLSMKDKILQLAKPKATEDIGQFVLTL